MKCLLALDPGSDKCGYAVVRYDGTVGEKGVVALNGLAEIVSRICTSLGPDVVVIGKGTAGAQTHSLVRDVVGGILVDFGEEKHSTREARERYFRENPPRGFWRLVPVGLQFPPCPVDDYAAWIIGERYIQTHGLSA
ncbi:MAG: hypothetical protein WA705_28330 [Candidatus Ozemobacteraceae bacterium]